MSTQFAAIILAMTSLCRVACAAPLTNDQSLLSPNGDLYVNFRLDDKGKPHFEFRFRDSVVATGSVGLALLGAPPLDRNFEIIRVDRNSRDQTYAIPVGKASKARDHHNELVVALRERAAPHRHLELAFRAFDDGVAFRYSLPKQVPLGEFTIADELTQLTPAGDFAGHVLPLNSFTTSYEKYYETLPIAQLKPDALLALPMLLEVKDSPSGRLWLAITEANLRDYAGMYLAPHAEKTGRLVAKLSPLPGRDDGAKVFSKTPFASPWRIVMVGDNPGRLLESNIIFNLSEECAIADTSWIKPGRTTFPWWNGYVLEGVDFTPGLNTSTYKHYIDFCAKHGIEYHSLDGTDMAWYGGPITPTGPVDVTKAVPKIDMPELLRYAKEKGVRLRLWMHWKALQPQIDRAFKTYEEWGIEGVMIDFMDRDDQEMVAFYHEVAEKAARHHLTVTWHGAYKPTGMERTWPNVFNFEAALNQEYNKWDAIGTPPAHNLNVAFIRAIAGPVDYHHGGMRNAVGDAFKAQFQAPMVKGTRGHQLALYVVYPNPLPMMADYPEAYEGQPGLDFIASVPTSWDETRVLHAEFGRAIVVARRKGDAWYLGGMTGDHAADLELLLDFLGEGNYACRLMLDDARSGATSIAESDRVVSAADKLKTPMPIGGGFVATLTPAD